MRLKVLSRPRLCDLHKKRRFSVRTVNDSINFAKGRQERFLMSYMRSVLGSLLAANETTREDDPRHGEVCRSERGHYHPVYIHRFYFTLSLDIS